MTKMTKKSEHEFFRTAAHWLACQWQITHQAPAKALRVTEYDAIGTMLGWLDCRSELYCIVQSKNAARADASTAHANA
jgi:hypothetical protein